ncbi:hypothetical protein ACFWR9_20845 [Streptomyces sp. NPDC058534]|uniref:hypothetical protein n=1 Tax=Streptomyces sp. NPDC058534 TaxID=3346541 RepID=UPI0036534D53
MSSTPPGIRRVSRVTPRRLGAAAAIYGVFVAGWYLGQPVTPECHVDQADLDRIAEKYETEPSPTPTPSAYPSRYGLGPDLAHIPGGGAYATQHQTITAYAVSCTNDTSERPRMRAWFEGQWQ